MKAKAPESKSVRPWCDAHSAIGRALMDEALEDLGIPIDDEAALWQRIDKCEECRVRELQAEIAEAGGLDDYVRKRAAFESSWMKEADQRDGMDFLVEGIRREVQSVLALKGVDEAGYPILPQELEDRIRS